ncbi:hypothetical protein QR680_017031 [Steinernema hermaphroditum]|uniref:Uncharacterized protein n=1 Tax=Steinernema hermaphroditum TaxID=289476 RepID=A0AA39HE81_9BILA|nr:hypothetical protein QR680_017031 [Steinernema hermaphroditum]
MPNATVAPYAECFDSIEECESSCKFGDCFSPLICEEYFSFGPACHQHISHTNKLLYITAVFSIIACIILGLILAFLAYSYLGKWRRKRRRRKHRINVPPYVVPQAYHRSLTRW